MIKKNKRGWRQSFFQLWQSSWPERHIILWDTGQNFKWTFGQFKGKREKKGENRWHKLDLSAQTIAVAVLVGKVQKQIAAMPTNCVFLVKKTLAEPFDPFCMAQRNRNGSSLLPVSSARDINCYSALKADFFCLFLESIFTSITRLINY